MVTAGAGAECDRLRSILLPDRQQPLRDVIERIVPGDPFPPAGAARAEASQRIFQAVGMINQIERHRSDRAEPAMIERRLRIAFNLNQLIILDVKQHATAAMAAATDAFQHPGLLLLSLATHYNHQNARRSARS